MAVQTRDGRDPVVRPLTEATFARWLAEQGMRPIISAGRYWTRLGPGFYAPIHPLARLTADEAVPPPRPHWGFRAVLRDDAGTAANGTLPVHLLRDVENYDADRLSRNRRKHLLQCSRRVRFLTLDDSTLLAPQGYRVVQSALDRTRHAKPPSREAYLARLDAYTASSHRLIIAGLVDDTLGGYLSAYAVDGTAYFEDLFVASDALKTYINMGLIHEMVQACRRSGAVREIVNGLHAREDPSLDIFKEGMGFPVVHLPTKVRMNRGVRKFLQFRYPDKLYRLEGSTEMHARLPGSPGAGGR